MSSFSPHRYSSDMYSRPLPTLSCHWSSSNLEPLTANDPISVHWLLQELGQPPSPQPSTTYACHWPPQWHLASGKQQTPPQRQLPSLPLQSEGSRHRAGANCGGKDTGDPPETSRVYRSGICSVNCPSDGLLGHRPGSHSKHTQAIPQSIMIAANNSHA